MRIAKITVSRGVSELNSTPIRVGDFRIFPNIWKNIRLFADHFRLFTVGGPISYKQYQKGMISGKVDVLYFIFMKVCVY